MAERLWLGAAHGEGEGEANGAGESVGRRAGFSCRGQQRQDAHGTWPARAEGRRRVATRGACFLNRSATTFTERFLKNRDSVLMTSLIARIRRVNTANPSIYCKNGIYEKCRPTIHLQLLFKDQHLNRRVSEVT